MTALCAGHPRLPPAAWDDDAPHAAHQAAHQAAARICRTCPLLPSCRVQAATDRASGVYGAALYHDGRKIAELPSTDCEPGCGHAQLPLRPQRVSP